MKDNRKGNAGVLAKSGAAGNWRFRELGIPPSATRGFKNFLISSAVESGRKRELRRKLLEEAGRGPIPVPKGRRKVRLAVEQAIGTLHVVDGRAAGTRRKGRLSPEFEAFVAASRPSSPTADAPATALHRRMQSGDV